MRCQVFRGLPKELEEEVNKFLEVTPVPRAARGAERVRESRHDDDDLRTRHARPRLTGPGQAAAVGSDPPAGEREFSRGGFAQRRSDAGTGHARPRDRHVRRPAAAAARPAAGLAGRPARSKESRARAGAGRRDRPCSRSSGCTARALRTTLESLTQRIRARVSREIGDDYLVTSGAPRGGTHPGVHPAAAHRGGVLPARAAAAGRRAALVRGALAEPHRVSRTCTSRRRSRSAWASLCTGRSSGPKRRSAS